MRKKNLLTSSPMRGGVQHVYKFRNNYGASVIRHRGSYSSEEGFWELAVIKFNGDSYRLTYETDITNDVIGRLEEAEVDKLLTKINKLKEQQ